MKYSLTEFENAVKGMNITQVHDWVLKQNGLTSDPGEWTNKWSDLPGDDCIEQLVSSSDVDHQAPPSVFFETAYKRVLLSSQVKRGGSEQRMMQMAFDMLADYHNALIKKTSAP